MLLHSNYTGIVVCYIGSAEKAGSHIRVDWIQNGNQPSHHRGQPDARRGDAGHRQRPRGRRVHRRGQREAQERRGRVRRCPRVRQVLPVRHPRREAVQVPFEGHQGHHRRQAALLAVGQGR